MKDKICEKCLNRNTNFANFCNFCGNKFLQTTSMSSSSKFIETFRSRWALIWIVVGVFILAVLFELMPYLSDFLDLLISSIWMYGLMFIWVLWVRNRNELSLKAILGKLNSINTIGIPYLVLIVIVGMGFSISCTYMSIYLIIQLFGEISLIETLFDGGDLWPKNFSSIQAYLHAGFVVSILVLIAPIFEEVVFRGMFMTRWVVKWGYKRGIIFSSLFFGILHPGIIGPTVMGVILSCLYNRTKSLWVSVFCHMINNSIVVILVLITGDPGSIETEEFTSLSSMLPILGLFIVSSVIISLVLYKLWPSKSDIIPYQHNLQNLHVNNE